MVDRQGGRKGDPHISFLRYKEAKPTTATRAIRGIKEGNEQHNNHAGSSPAATSTLIVAISKNKSIEACAVYGVMEIAI